MIASFLAKINEILRRDKQKAPNSQADWKLVGKSDLSMENESLGSLPPPKVHQFWAYGSLGKIESLSAKSFQKNGFLVNLWSYEDIGNVPSGVIRKSASDLIPEDQVFTYENGSIAAFANLFRYTVLLSHGGLWADSDVICLLNADSFRSASVPGFFVTERRQSRNDMQINNNVIHAPKDAHMPLLELALAVAKEFPSTLLRWGDTGPRLLTGLVNMYPQLRPVIMEPDFANPVNFWDCPHILLSSDAEIGDSTGFLHCYNEMWRRANLDKNAKWPDESLMQKLARELDLDADLDSVPMKAGHH